MAQPPSTAHWYLGRALNSSVRLFVAVELPGPTVRLLRSLPQPDLPGLRWTTPAQWHVTLRFLGDVHEPSEVADALIGISSRLDVGRVEARLGPATAWFAGGTVLHVPVDGLEMLAGVVHDATSSWGPAEHSGFAGHVTLARFRGPGPGPPDIAGEPVAGQFHVAEMVLFASSMGPAATTYKAIARAPLVAGLGR